VVGTYTLRTLNGDPVPAVDEFGNEVTAGSVRLNANGTFSTSHTYRISSSNEITLVSNGTYTRSGNDLTLLFEDPETGEMLSVDAVWDGDRLTVDDGFDVWVYER
jgi:hypothetical protein